MINVPKKIRQFRFIKTKEKIPFELDWNKTNNYSYEDALENGTFKNNGTYGVLCGYKGLIVVDLDNENVQNELLKEDLFKKTFKVKTAGKGLLHFYFFSDKTDSFKCLDDQKNTLIDIQGTGKQVIGAGSILSNGKPYIVFEDLEIQHIVYKDLKKILSKYNYDKIEEKKSNLTEDSSLKPKDPIIAQIKSSISIKNLLDKIGISTKKNPTECPFHSSVSGKCFSYTDEVFFCFHCEEKGDLITLFQKAYNVDFMTAKSELTKIAGLNQNVSKENKKEKESKTLIEYKELNIKRFTIFKSKDETIYKIDIGAFNITLTPDTILGSSDFRKKYFNETGYLLDGVPNDKWIELVNHWVHNFGQIIDNTDDSNTEYMIKETILSELQNFAVVNDPVEATSYGRCLFISLEDESIFVCNKVLQAIINKNQFKINMSRVKVILEEFIKGNSKVIRTGKTMHRFFRFNLEKLPYLIFDKKAFKEEGEEL